MPCRAEEDFGFEEESRGGGGEDLGEPDCDRD